MKRFFLLLVAIAQAAPGYQEKLELQWQKFAEAQSLLVEKMGNASFSDRIVSREEWESILSLKGDFQWKAADSRALIASQKKRIEIAREKFRRESLFDLARLRASAEKVEAFCASVPKGGMLHIHPSGTLDRSTISEIFSAHDRFLDLKSVLEDLTAGRSGMLYENEIAWLKTLGDTPRYSLLSEPNQAKFQDFMFLPPGKQAFKRFQSVFRFLMIPLFEDADSEKAIMDFAKRAVREGVIYVEFTNPSGPELQEIIEKVQAETGLMIRINWSFNRMAPGERLNEQAERFLAMPANPLVVGIDFLADETDHPALEKGQFPYGLTLRAVRFGKSTLHRTMHAGELGDHRNPRDAMILGAERLGHAVSLRADPVAMEYAVSRGIAVETNLSSNLRLTDVRSVKEHPFLDYLRLGIPVSLSTDDEGIFETDINRECELAVAETDVSYAEWKEMAFNSIETSFAAKSDKVALLEKLRANFAIFEADRARIQK